MKIIILILILILIIIFLVYKNEVRRREWNRLSKKYYERGKEVNLLNEDIRILVNGDVVEKLPVKIKYQMAYQIEKQIWIG